MGGDGGLEADSEILISTGGARFTSRLNTMIVWGANDAAGVVDSGCRYSVTTSSSDQWTWASLQAPSS